ncbi:MFS transporter [Lacrimispora algidixylanolytica]|uniref:MFS transporter n=1 Tax=Lacrimispora algidixylanolytica TaxID=94868 RepID=A0A419T2N2_9FIRM|nr:MFS transporter [Lacrimispora algidixylanolytica]RKD31701.1 MFS transporter [Lacrimispora algidixylanolytica]
MKTRRNIYIMFAISFLQGMVFYGPVATLYRQVAGVNVFQITIIESISLALCIGLELPWGIVADRIGYRKTLILCSGIYFLSKIVFWRAEGFADFLLERILLSVVMAGFSGCDVSILYLSCKEEESQKVFGIYQFLQTAGLLGASLVYSVYIGENYRMAGFLTMASYGIAAVLAFGIREVKSPKRENGNTSNLLDVFLLTVRDKRFLLAVIGMGLLAEANQTITVFLNQIQYVKAGMDVKTIGFVYILVTLSGMMGIWSHWFTKRMGGFSFGLSMFICGAVSCVVLAITNQAVISVAAILLLRLCASLLAPLSTQLQNCRIKTRDRATALSMYAVLLEGIGVVTNVIFGQTANNNISYAMGCGAFLCTLGAILFYLFYLKEGKRLQI